MRYLSLLFLIPAAILSGAANGDPDNWCRHGSFLHDPAYREAEVTGAKVNFYGDAGSCPDLHNSACQAKAYLVAGNHVLVSRSFHGFACAWFGSGKRETVGWLPESSLKSVAAQQPSWIGSWSAYDDKLDIAKLAGAQVHVSGTAYWHGMNNVVHDGSVDGTGVPRGDMLQVREGECQVTLRAVGGYLIASDNSQCGGMNVRFDGVYRRK